MGKKTEAVYNINVMRPAILAARRGGNSKALTEKFCFDNFAISKGYFTAYLNSVTKLYRAACDFVQLAHNYGSMNVAAVSEAREKIFPLWKDMLSQVEEDEHKCDLHVAPHDVDSIIGFAQKFMMDANKPLEDDDDFVAHKVWTSVPFRAFQKAIETDLGLRAENVNTLSPERRDFLDKERKFISRIRKTEGRISDSNAAIEDLKRLVAQVSGEETKAELNAKIEELTKSVDGLTKKLAGYKTDLEKLYNPEAPAAETEEPAPEPAPAETPAEAPAPVASKPARKSGKRTTSKAA